MAKQVAFLIAEVDGSIYAEDLAKLLDGIHVPDAQIRSLHAGSPLFIEVVSEYRSLFAAVGVATGLLAGGRTIVGRIITLPAELRTDFLEARTKVIQAEIDYIDAVQRRSHQKSLLDEVVMKANKFGGKVQEAPNHGRLQIDEDFSPGLG